MLCLLFLLLCTDETYQPDELPIGKLMAVATRNNLCAVTYMKSQPGFGVAIFDYDKGSFRIVEDGRIMGFSLVPIPVEEGFLLIDSFLGRFPTSLIDTGGTFLERVRLEEMTGWPEGSKLRHVAPVRTGKAVLTFSAPDTSVLAYWADFDAGKVARIGQHRVRSEDRRMFAWDGARLLLITCETGRIDLFDEKTGEMVKTLRPAEQPYHMKEKPSWKRDGRPQLILDQPIFTGSSLSLLWRQFPERQGNPGDETRTLGLRVDKDGMSPESHWVLSRYGTRALVYDPRTREINLMRVR